MRSSTQSLRLALNALAVLAVSAPLAWAATASRPTLESQLAAAKAPKRSALDRFIRANQNFSGLRPEESFDRLPVPLWLRAAWRKAHPEGNYSATNPTGGYPHVLKEAVEWTRHHSNLAPGMREADVAEPPLKTGGGTNVLISGPTGPRSESDIRINFKNPLQIIGASNNLEGSGRQAQFYSSTGGATWGQTTLPLPAGDAFNSDPTVDWTSNGVAWSTTIGINNSFTQLRIRSFRSTDGGATWKLDGTVSSGHTSADKQIQWVDHSATSPFKDNIYVIWHNDDPAFVNRRTATGWKTPVKVSGTETIGTAIGGDVKTNSAGQVFAFWPATGNRKVLVAKSTNGGATFARPVSIATTFDGYDIGVPSFNRRRALIYLSGGAYKAAAKNNVYAAWTDLTGAAGCNSPANEPGANAASACKTRIWFSRSTDGGATWSAPKMINNRPGKSDQFNQWLAVDETNGRIGVIYYDTVGDSTRRTTNVWYQSSANDGTTWTVPLKVSTGRSDETGGGAELGNQYGDYNSLSGFMGKFFPSWTDRRGGGREGIWTAPIADP